MSAGVDAELLDLMAQSVTVAAQTALSQYAVPTYGAATSYVCRVENKIHMVRDATGREVVADGTVYLATGPTIAPSALLTMPDGTTPPILSVNNEPDETGNNYYTALHFGRAGSRRGLG